MCPLYFFLCTFQFAGHEEVRLFKSAVVYSLSSCDAVAYLNKKLILHNFPSSIVFALRSLHTTLDATL